MNLPVLVAVMAAAVAVGLAAERRWHGRAERGSRAAMGLMLKWILPLVYFVLVSRLHVDVRLFGGLVAGWVVLAIVGTLAWLVADRVLRLPRATVGAVVLAVIISNTGYFGLPLTRAVLGTDQLGNAVAWDSLVASPMFFIVAFGVGAAFGPAGRRRGPAEASGTPGGAAEREAESRLLAFVRNPLLWASIAGLALPVDAPDWTASIAQDVVVALLPVGFLVVGVQLAAEAEHEGSILRGRNGRLISPEVATVVGLRLVVAPLLILGASAAALHLPAGMLLQAAAPTGLNGMLVAHRFGLDLRPIAASIVWTTTLMTLGVVAVTLVG